MSACCQRLLYNKLLFNIYIYIYIYIYKVKLVSLVEGDLKAPFQ